MVSFHLKKIFSQNGLHTTRTVVLYNYQLIRIWRVK
ncbi:hypothetical protein [Escherichia phage KK4]|nr:hypothetical protein [Escherichia phage GADU22]WMM91690.1 hypothetical protein [Escherichia phage KK4]